MHVIIFAVKLLEDIVYRRTNTEHSSTVTVFEDICVVLAAILHPKKYLVKEINIHSFRIVETWRNYVRRKRPQYTYKHIYKYYPKNKNTREVNKYVNFFLSVPIFAKISVHKKQNYLWSDNIHASSVWQNGNNRFLLKTVNWDYVGGCSCKKLIYLFLLYKTSEWNSDFKVKGKKCQLIHSVNGKITHW